MMDKFKRYRESVAFLEGLSNLPLTGDYMIDKKHADIYLKRMRYFLDLLGNPDRGMKFIHIGGTSGKGTVTDMVHEIIRASGKKVGSFMSPYVITSIEKIKVGAEYIDPDEFADIVDHLKRYIDDAYVSGPFGRPSYFEIFLAIALIYFKRRDCEWVVLEVGLGGRFDATNVIEKPLVTAITNIDYDHTELLGRTLSKIAFDKAGIIKKGSTFFTTEHREPLIKIFGDICTENSVRLELLPNKSSYMENNIDLASAIARHIKIGDRSIDLGLNNSKLPCRFEMMQKHPLVIIDGAHNRSKIRTTVDNLKKLSYSKLYLIIGIALNKDHVAILNEIIPLADRVHFTRFGNKDRKCAHPKGLFEKSKRYFKKGSTYKIFLDSSVALSESMAVAGSNDVILITGSFFLGGEMRKRWYSEESVLELRRAF